MKWKKCFYFKIYKFSQKNRLIHSNNKNEIKNKKSVSPSNFTTVKTIIYIYKKYEYDSQKLSLKFCWTKIERTAEMAASFSIFIFLHESFWIKFQHFNLKLPRLSEDFFTSWTRLELMPLTDFTSYLYWKFSKKNPKRPVSQNDATRTHHSIFPLLL